MSIARPVILAAFILAIFWLRVCYLTSRPAASRDIAILSVGRKFRCPGIGKGKVWLVTFEARFLVVVKRVIYDQALDCMIICSAFFREIVPPFRSDVRQCDCLGVFDTVAWETIGTIVGLSLLALFQLDEKVLVTNELRSPKNWLGPAILIGLGLVYVCIIAMNRGGGVAGRSHPGVGQAIGNIDFSALTADAHTSSDEWVGQVVLLNFWGTWCPPCRKEFPSIVQMDRRFSGDDAFRLVSISSPSGADGVAQLREATIQYLAKSGADFATYYDANGQSLRRVASAARLPSSGIPITIILDRTGVIRGVWQGFHPGDERDMETLVGELLEERRAI